MRIGIDVTCWPNVRGYGRFTRELVTAMTKIPGEDEFVLFIDRTSAVDALRFLPHCTVVEVETRVAPSKAASAAGSRTPADVLRMSAAVYRHRPDAFFFPTVYSWFPLPLGVPSVVTIHDAIAERFPSIVVPGFRARTLWRLKLALAIRQARRILTVSEYAREDIARIHSIPLDSIAVAVEAPAAVYHPSTAEEAASEVRKLGVDPADGWFVYVGGMSPHKNVPNLVRCFSRLAAELDRPPALILAGPVEDDVFHGEHETVMREIIAGGVEDLVKWAGYVADESLRRIFSGALALVLPSRCEGFGLPAVEAAACGAPAIATTESPLPTLLDGGGIFVRPGDDDGLYRAMRELATDGEMRATMGARALDCARRLSWDVAARAALDTIRGAV